MKNINCNYCNSCDSCGYCNSCNYCNYCGYCDYCNSCNSCNFCDYCNSCNSCNSCDYCNSCNSCDSCDYCNYCKNIEMTEDNLFCYAKDENKDGFQKNRYRIFNKDVDKDLYFEELKKSRELLKYFKLCFFVKEEIMTEEEKKNNEKYKTIGGFLKVLKYEEAWKIWWRNLSEENKNRMKELKNFDKEIFKNITGIDIEEKLVEVTCNGKTTKITKEKAIDLKLI